MRQYMNAAAPAATSSNRNREPNTLFMLFKSNAEQRTSKRGRTPFFGHDARLSTRFHNYGDVFRDGDRCPTSEIRRHIWPQRHKDTEKNTLQVARSTRRRAAAGEACQPQTNDHWTVARSFVCGLRASRRGLRCRPPASSASVSQCLRGLSKSRRRRHYEILY